MLCCRPCWIGRLRENYEPDPKGFLGYRSTCQLGWFCLSGRRSAGKTFRVSDDGDRAFKGEKSTGGGEELQ